MIVSLVGCRALSEGPAAPLVALFPLMGVVMSGIFLRGEQLHAIGLLGILVSVGGVILLLLGGP